MGIAGARFDPSNINIAPGGSGEIIRKWALSPHLLLFPFQHRHMPISGPPDFPLPSYLP
jgi:hypothetical protein